MLSSFVMNIEGEVPGVKGYRAAEKKKIMIFCSLLITVFY